LIKQTLTRQHTSPADARWSAIGFGLITVLLLAWIAAFSIGQPWPAAVMRRLAYHPIDEQACLQDKASLSGAISLKNGI